MRTRGGTDRSEPKGAVVKGGVVNQTHPSEEGKPDWRRWLMLFIFAYIGAVSGVLFLSLGAIAPQAAPVYGVDPNQIAFTGAVFYILFGPVAFVNMYILSFPKHGLYITTVGTAVLQALGAGLRCVESDNANGWPWALAGSVVLGLPNALLLGSFTTLSSNWFPPHERGTATTVSSVSIQAGMMIGALLPVLMVDESGPAIPGQIYQLNLVQAVVAGLSAVLAIIFFRSHPKYCPTTRQLNVYHQDQSEDGDSDATSSSNNDVTKAKTTGTLLPPPPGILESIRLCLTNGYFIAMTFSIGITLPIYWNISLFIANGLTSRGFSQAEYLIPMTLFQAIAIPMIFIAGPLIDCTRAYYTLSLSSLTIACLSLAAFTILMTGVDYGLGHVAELSLVTVALCIYGAAVTLAVPALLEFAVEVTYPAPEAISTTLIFTVCELVGLILYFTMSYLPGNGGNVFNTVAVGICVLVLAGAWIASDLVFHSCLRRRSKAIAAIMDGSTSWAQETSAIGRTA